MKIETRCPFCGEKEALNRILAFLQKRAKVPVVFKGVSGEVEEVMGGCRETFCIWFYIKQIWKPYYPGYSKWRAIKRLFKLRVDNEYFWHDSFGRYFNRWIICPIIGHRHVVWLSDGNCDSDKPSHHCFNCEQEVDPGIDKLKEAPNGD